LNVGTYDGHHLPNSELVVIGSVSAEYSSDAARLARVRRVSLLGLPQLNDIR